MTPKKHLESIVYRSNLFIEASKNEIVKLKQEIVEIEKTIKHALEENELFESAIQKLEEEPVNT